MDSRAGGRQLSVLRGPNRMYPLRDEDEGFENGVVSVTANHTPLVACQQEIIF